MSQSLGDHYLTDVIAEFQKYKRMADRALAQVDDTAFFATLDAEANSMAILVKHLAGNMRSRWRDFLTSDGEKPDRHRDSEFIIAEGDTRDELMAGWEAGWALLFGAIEPLSADDLLRTVTIRRQPHTVMQAINRQLTHYPNHIGQIILLAKHAQGDRWQTLTIPRGESEHYNASMIERMSTDERP